MTENILFRHLIFKKMGLWKGAYNWTYGLGGPVAFPVGNEPRIECDVDDWLKWVPRLLQFYENNKKRESHET